MLARPFAITLLLVSWAASSSAAATHQRHSNLDRSHARPAVRKAVIPPVLANDTASDRKRAVPRRCVNRQVSTTAAASSTASATQTQESTSTSSSAPPATTTTPPPATNGGGGGGAGKPAHWPSVTQSGPIPSIRVANKQDPNLISLSHALNNKQNDLFTKLKTGDLTYYGQGLGACGDTYDNESMTAAVSQLLYDKWPGANGEQNRNPICGPFAPGRNVLTMKGTFEASVKSSVGGINIGGDGLPNCIPGVQCHIPLTATVTNPANGKSVIVSIVDRCVGCAAEDIDMTPAAYAKIADMDLGRVEGIQWHFNSY